MKNGILRDDEGFDVQINGVTRTFRDRKQAAYEAGGAIKNKNRAEIVQIMDRATGTKTIILEDGRTA